VIEIVEKKLRTRELRLVDWTPIRSWCFEP
jgi:hypothetical protein